MHQYSGLLLLWTMPLAMAWVAYDDLAYRPYERDSIRQVCAQLRVGEAPDRVRYLIGHTLDPRDRLALDASSKEWALSSPLEWGAKNWILYLFFEKKRLVGWRVRTYDGRSEKPRDDPPPDVGAGPANQ